MHKFNIGDILIRVKSEYVEYVPIGNLLQITDKGTNSYYYTYIATKERFWDYMNRIENECIPLSEIGKLLYA